MSKRDQSRHTHLSHRRLAAAAATAAAELALETLEPRQLLTTLHILTYREWDGYQWSETYLDINIPGLPFWTPSNPAKSSQPPCNCPCNCPDPGKSDEPVRYMDGLPIVPASDLVSTGFGEPFGLNRSWGNRTDSGLTGYGWAFDDLPFLVGLANPDTPTTIDFIARVGGRTRTDAGNSNPHDELKVGGEGVGLSADFFDNREVGGVVPSSPPPMMNSYRVVAKYPASGTIVQSSPDGEIETYYDFSNGDLSGKLKSRLQANGVLLQVHYSGSQPSEVTRSADVDGTTTEESFKFDYVGTGLTHAGLLQRVTLRRKSWTGGSEPGWVDSNDIRRVDYSYDAGGRLRTAAVTVPSAAQTVTSITRGGTGNKTATVTLAGHGLSVGDLFTVAGASQGAYDGTFVVASVSGSTFTYQMDDDPGGSATLASGATSIAVNRPIDVTYYRYYANDDAPGYENGLRYVLGPEAFARFDAAIGTADPFAADDATVAAYADYAFEYDTFHRVSKEVAAGADGGAFKFDYAFNSLADPDDTAINFNFWRTKTTEILPDDTPGTDADNPRNVVYMNEVGQVMLTVNEDGAGGRWGTFYQYDAFGRRILTAYPSAVNLPSEGYLDGQGDLLNDTGDNYQYLNDTTGRIDLTDYYGSTAATSSMAGGVVGYEQDRKLEHGEMGVGDGRAATLAYASGTVTVTVPSTQGYTVGQDVLITGAADAAYNGLFTVASVPSGTTFTYALTPAPTSSSDAGLAYLAGQKIKTTETTYIERDNGASGTNYAQVFPVAAYTEYAAADVTPLTPGARTTSYAYAWASGTVRQTSMTVTRPPIAVAQNGPGSSGVPFTVAYDALGNAEWLKDEDGFLTYTRHDVGTGAVYPRSIDDVDTAGVANATNYAHLPSGWTTPGGGGLNLLTAYEIDKLGRPTKLTDPNGNVWYDVYDDANHETRTYPGFDGTNTATPIVITREDRAHGYLETFSLATAPHLDGGGVPDGGESIDASHIRSLTRTLTDNFGYATEVDDYFDLTDVAYSTDSLLGAAGVNYNRTRYAYDARGNLIRTEDAVGTVTRTVYDGLDRPVSTWVGTDDRPSPASFDFDFGTPTSPVASGYIGWSDGAYAASPGYGWTAGSISYVDRATGSDVNRDLAYTTDGTFAVDIANGTYLVTITVGDTFAHDRQGIFLEGNQVDQIDNAANEYVTRVYAVRVSDGQLTLGLKDMGGSNPHVVLNALSIAALGSPSDASGMTKVAENLYDTYDPATAVAGDSNLTRVIRYPGGGVSARVDEIYYDWRDRPVMTKSGVKLNGSDLNDYANEGTNVQRLIVRTTYDNLGEATQTDQYDGDAVQTVASNAAKDADRDGIPDAPGTNKLRARISSDYDDLGRVWRNKVWYVDPSSGAVSNSLKTWYWYDKRGNLIKTLAPGGLATKYTYDGTGRVVKQYITDGGGDVVPGSSGTWDNATDVTGDNVLEQTETQYDGNSNPILTIHKLHFHDDTNVGELSNVSGTPKARIYYSAFYYDAVDRLIAAVDVGTNGGTLDGTGSGADLDSNNDGIADRPASVPARSDKALVTSHVYDDANGITKVTDPRGVTNRTYVDLLGRTTKTIANYVDGTPSDADDQTTEYTYDGNDNVLTMKAELAGGAFQTTQYVYGVTTGGGSGVNSNDLLAQVKYPDKSTGNPGSGTNYAETFTYDALGEALASTDRNGTVHAYAYDDLGRLTSDVVTTLGTGVDSSVRRLEYTFDSAGRAFQFTSRSGTSSTSTLVNQVQRAYNGYGQLTVEYQAHGGAVSTGSSPRVSYAYNGGGSGDTPTNNNSRRTSMTYPNGRVLTYTYDGLNDRISRVGPVNCSAGADTLESYYYLGLDTVVERVRPEQSVKMTYIKQGTESNGEAGDQYAGLDRFGRVVDERWVKYSGTNVTATLDDFKYAYDPDGNPLYKKNEVNSTFSELYHASGTSGEYDKLNRLTGFVRGTLSDANSDGVYDTVATPNTLAGSQKTWSLDAVGNWNNTTTDGGTAVTRGHNAQNQATNVGGVTLTFDNAGNTTKDETGKQFVYDAWNRLKTVKNSGGATIQTYKYDALGRRVAQGSDSSDQYYSDRWQVIEEQVTTTGSSGSVTTTKSQYVWSPFYVDDLIVRDRDADGNAATGDYGLSSSGLEQHTYAEADASHDVTSLSDASGTVLQRFVYDPYGAATVLTAAWATTTDGYNWVYRQQGGRYDTTSGLLDFRNRMFSPTLGRWMQQDPLNYVDGNNVYQYERSSPLGSSDPLGLLGKPHIVTDPTKIPTANHGPNGMKPNSPVFPAILEWLTGSPEIAPGALPDVASCPNSSAPWVDIKSFHPVSEDERIKTGDKPENPERKARLRLIFKYEGPEQLKQKANDKEGFYMMPEKVITGTKKVNFVHYVATGTVYWKCNGTTYSQDFDTTIDNGTAQKGTGAHYPEDTDDYYEALKELEDAYNKFLKEQGAEGSDPTVMEDYGDKDGKRLDPPVAVWIHRPFPAHPG